MNDATPAQNRTLAASGAESGLPTDQGAREARYAEAIFNARDGADNLGSWSEITKGSQRYWGHYARGAMAVADAEIAAQVEAAVSVVRADLARHYEAHLAAERRAYRALREAGVSLSDELRRLGDACGGESARALAFYEASGKATRYLSDLRAVLTPSPAEETR